MIGEVQILRQKLTQNIEWEWQCDKYGAERIQGKSLCTFRFWAGETGAVLIWSMQMQYLY